MTVPEHVLVKVDWSEAEGCPARHSNQVLAQLGPPSGQGIPDGIYLTFGNVSPPVFVGDEEQRAVRAAELRDSALKVDVDARIHVNREVLDDIIRVLQTTAAQYDAAKAAQQRQERV